MKSCRCILTFVILGVLATACTTPPADPTPNATPVAQTTTRGPLEGAWKVVEMTITGGPNAGSNITPQPSVYIFSKNHYSLMRIDGTQPRALWKDNVPRAEQTDAALRAAILPLIGNAGTYSVSGTTLTNRPIVAVSPNFMQEGTTDVFEFRTEGDTLWLTQKSTTEPITETSWKLLRIE